MINPLEVFNSIGAADPTVVLGFGIVGAVVKWAIVVILLVYCLFAGVVIKQVSIMSETLEDPANGAVKTIAWTHLIASLLLTLAVILLG